MNRKTIFTSSITIILVIGLASLSSYFYQENTKIKKILKEDGRQIENLTQEIKSLKKSVIPEEISEWNFYTNDKSGFKIRYPKEWLAVEQESVSLGLLVFFTVKGLPSKSGLPGPISISEYKGPCTDDYEMYISEPNTSYKLHTKEQITTQSGLEGVKTTWFTRTWDEDFSLKNCLPITIFEDCQGTKNTSRAILIFIADGNYLDVYNAMIRTFEFK